MRINDFVYLVMGIPSVGSMSVNAEYRLRITDYRLLFTVHCSLITDYYLLPPFSFERKYAREISAALARSAASSFQNS